MANPLGNYNPNFAAARERVRKELTEATAKHFGLTVEQWRNTTGYEKTQLRRKHGVYVRPKKTRPVPNQPAPVDERAQAMEMAIMAERSQVSEEDFKRWYDSRPPSKRYASTKTSGKHVVWTTPELEIIAEHCAAQMLKQGIFIVPEKHDRVGLSFLISAFQEGVKHLPRERRRLVEARAGVQRHLPYIKSALRKGAKKLPQESIVKTEAQPVPIPAAQIKEAPAEVIHFHGGKTPEPNNTETHVDGDMSTEQLVAMLVGRILRTLEKPRESAKVAELEQKIKEQQEYQEMITTEMAELRARVDQSTNTQFTMKPIEEAALAQPEAKEIRVAIIGCLKQQFDRVVAGVRELKLPVQLNLIHIDTNKNGHNFTADYCLSLRWIDHDWWPHIQRAVPNKFRRPFVNGGESAAIRQIATWFMAESAAIHA